MRKEASQLSVHVKPCRKSFMQRKTILYEMFTVWILNHYWRSQPFSHIILSNKWALYTRERFSKVHTSSKYPMLVYVIDKDEDKFKILGSYVGVRKISGDKKKWYYAIYFSSNIDKNFKYFYGFIIDISKTLIVL